MKLLTPIKAIRQKCLDCSCWSNKEVKLCPHTTCVLYPYRFGHRPTKGSLIEADSPKNP